MSADLAALLKMDEVQRKAWAQKMALEYDPPMAQAPIRAPQQSGFAQMLNPQQGG